MASVSQITEKYFGGHKRGKSAQTQVFRSQSEVVTSLAMQKHGQQNMTNSSDNDDSSSLPWGDNTTGTGLRTQSDAYDARQFQSEVVGLTGSSPLDNPNLFDSNPFEQKGPRQSGFKSARPVLIDVQSEKLQPTIPERTEESSATPVIDKRPTRRTAIIKKQQSKKSSSLSSSSKSSYSSDSVRRRTIKQSEGTRVKPGTEKKQL